jgi:hypothetical protein
MAHRIIRVRLSEELFRKYKVFCAINDVSMTQQTEKVVSNFINHQSGKIKIIKVV